MTWNISTLGEVVERDGGLIQTGPFGSQLHQSDYVSEGIPVIMPKDIADGRIDTSTIARISEESADRLNRHKLRRSAIVVPRRGEITKRAFIREEQTGWLCGTGCLQIVLEGEELLPDFLYYYMEQNEVARWLEQHAVGTTMLNLSGAIVSDLPLKYPIPSVQRRIADILSTYDDLIENNRRRMELLEGAARQLYCEWFIRFRYPGHEHARIENGLPDVWQRQTFGDLCIEVRESVSPDEVDCDAPYVGLEHIPRRSITISNWGRAEQVTSTKHRFREGDILFGKIRPYFHKVAIAFLEGVASSDAIVIRPVEDRFRGFVLMIASSDPFVAATAQSMKEGSKMPRADWKQMKAYPVAVPPDGILETFERTVESVIEQLKTLAFMNRKLRAARDLLLPRLMSGDVAV